MIYFNPAKKINFITCLYIIDVKYITYVQSARHYLLFHMPPEIIETLQYTCTLKYNTYIIIVRDIVDMNYTRLGTQQEYGSIAL